MFNVIFRDQKSKVNYELILKFGGARVLNWTLKAVLHLQKANPSELTQLTHIFVHPEMIRESSDIIQHPSIISTFYIDEFLINWKQPPKIDKFSLNNKENVNKMLMMWQDHEVKKSQRQPHSKA